MIFDYISNEVHMGPRNFIERQPIIDDGGSFHIFVPRNY
jgi:hypothetical protein